jgi:predicted metal-dependent phosphoesterase TrpH
MNAAARRRKKTKKEHGAWVGSHRHVARVQQAAAATAASEPNSEAVARFVAEQGRRLGDGARATAEQQVAVGITVYCSSE